MLQKPISICCLIGGLLSATGNSLAGEPVLVKLESAHKSSDHDCRTKADGNPSALMKCDNEAIAAANTAITRSPNNTNFDGLLSDMFESLLFARTGGEDALADRVAISAIYVKFAQRRAEILTGRRAAPVQGALVGGSGIFDWMQDKEQAKDLMRRWQSIRDSDCAVYAVPQCGAALDAALRDTVEAARK